MRRLLAADTAYMTAHVRDWVSVSAGKWRSAEVTLALPGPGAELFRDWYAQVVSERRSAAMRAGHPEHYLNTPGSDGIEVIEPIGETDLPWRIFYRTIDPAAELPVVWPSNFPVRFAAEIVDEDELVVGYSLRALRNVENGMEIGVERLALPRPTICPGYLSQIEELFLCHRVGIDNRVTVHHWNTAVSFAATGRALALCPASFVNGATPVAVVPLTAPDAELVTWMLYSNSKDSPSVSLILEVAALVDGDRAPLPDRATIA